MGKLGLPELIIIFCIALLVFGPDTPRLFRSLATSKTFNNSFFLSLTLILVLFALAELWLFYE